MAAGEVASKVVNDDVNGAGLDSTVLTPTAGHRISGVYTRYTAPEVALTGVVSDATGDEVTVHWKVEGLAGQTYPVSITVFEVADA